MAVSLAKRVNLAKRNVKAIDTNGVSHWIVEDLRSNDCNTLAYLFGVQENGKFNAKMIALHAETESIGRF
jgi:hypothetical protein